VKDDPFAALGLPARADLPDEEVRAAWKRIAAATHPDREDGGDAARYAAAAAAYDALRTSFGRGEALADLGPGGRAAGFRGRAAGFRGRGWRVALRAVAATGVTAAAVLAAGWTPATVGLLAGALTWVAVTSRPGLPGRRWRLRSGGDGSGGIGDPVRPRANVEGGGDAGQREGENLVRRGDARAAVGGHRAVAVRAEGREAGSQVGR
jgi:hypothetical protein